MRRLRGSLAGCMLFDLVANPSHALQACIECAGQMHQRGGNGGFKPAQFALDHGIGGRVFQLGLCLDADRLSHVQQFLHVGMCACKVGVRFDPAFLWQDAILRPVAQLNAPPGRFHILVGMAFVVGIDQLCTASAHVVATGMACIPIAISAPLGLSAVVVETTIHAGFADAFDASIPTLEEVQGNVDAG